MFLSRRWLFSEILLCGTLMIFIALFFFFQILDAMNRDCGIPLSHLQVDGGMTNNKILMQLQADILYIPVGQYALIPSNPNGHIFFGRTDFSGICNC